MSDDGPVDYARLAEITPEGAARGAVENIPDDALPMLAALWLSKDFDSEELRELAGLSRAEGPTARRLLPSVLASLGHPQIEVTNPYDDLPWRGYWQQIEWAQQVMDDLLSPYAAAQRVLEIAGDVPDLWEPAGGNTLMALLAESDQQPHQSRRIDDVIRHHLRSLQANDVPPLNAAPPSA